MFFRYYSLENLLNIRKLSPNFDLIMPSHDIYSHCENETSTAYSKSQRLSNNKKVKPLPNIISTVSLSTVRSAVIYIASDRTSLLKRQQKRNRHRTSLQPCVMSPLQIK